MVELAAPLNESVEPAIAVKVPALLKLPPMLSLPAAFIITEPVAAIVKLPQTSPLAFIVITIPAGTITMSVANGGTPVDQLVPVSQAPDEIAVLLAIAMAELKIRNKPRDRKSTRLNSSHLVI